MSKTNPKAPDLQPWEKAQFSQMLDFLYPDGSDKKQQAGIGHALVYMGRARLGDTKAGKDISEHPDFPPEALDDTVTLWGIGQDLTGSDLHFRDTPPEESGQWQSVGKVKRGQVVDHPYFMREGVATRALLGWGAVYHVTHLQAGLQEGENRDALRAELLDYVEDARENALALRYTRDGGDTWLNPWPAVSERLRRIAEAMEDGDLVAPLSIYDSDLPEPQPWGDSGRAVTPEMARDPFQAGTDVLAGGKGKSAAIPSNPFVRKATLSLMSAQHGLTSTYEGAWGRDATGHPVRVESLGDPYTGKAIFTVKGENATAADMDVGLAEALLTKVDMDCTLVHLLLLAHASDPGRRGNREPMNIPPGRVENALGISRARTKAHGAKERFETVKEKVAALSRIHVRFQEVTRRGANVSWDGALTPSPLWILSLQEYGQGNLFSRRGHGGWYLKAQEGLWADRFLHGSDSPQWTWLPVEFFDQIDRRRSDYSLLLAVYLLFHLRVNAKHGHRVKLSAATMLRLCGVSLERDRASSQRTGIKNKLSAALDTLQNVYGFKVDAQDIQTKWLEWEDWKGRVAYFEPPEIIAPQLFRGDSPEPAPLPQPGGTWTAAQIKQLRKQQNLTQAELGKRLDVSRHYVSMLENAKRQPSRKLRRLLDKVQKRR